MTTGLTLTIAAVLVWLSILAIFGVIVTSGPTSPPDQSHVDRLDNPGYKRGAGGMIWDDTERPTP